MNNEIIKEFPVLVYGNLERYNETISKGRCRIFYKGDNRNGTYITEEFAEKLLSTIPYTPVKGIYDNYDEDYTDHGAKRDLGRIYGIVPENPNLAWEKHLDEDGVEREYACVDVLIYTALYKEANEIIGKSQSMELYQPSIKGEYKIIKGKRLYEFKEASFLGLQVLGTDVEPCFEGAAFFSLYESLKDLVSKIEAYNLNFQKNNKGGAIIMNFKLSDNQKYSAIWSLLNPNYNEEGDWTVSYSVCEVYDEYAIAFNLETGSYERVYYTKDDENDSLSLGDKVKCYIVDVTEEEKRALDNIYASNENSYAKAEEILNKVPALEEKNSEFELKIEELNGTISTLETEKGEFSAQIEAAQNEISDLTAERDSLKSYKMEIEKQEKEAIFTEYEDQLDEEVLNTYRSAMDNYTAADLDKELAYELKKSNPTIFTKNSTPTFVPKDEPKCGITEILSKYKK